jgi:hypothetical protein
MKYRNGKKIVTDYIGKDKGKIAQIEEQIKRRNNSIPIISIIIRMQNILRLTLFSLL